MYSTMKSSSQSDNIRQMNRTSKGAMWCLVLVTISVLILAITPVTHTVANQSMSSLRRRLPSRSAPATNAGTSGASWFEKRFGYAIGQGKSEEESSDDGNHGMPGKVGKVISLEPKKVISLKPKDGTVEGHSDQAVTEYCGFRTNKFGDDKHDAGIAGKTRYDVPKGGCPHLWLNLKSSAPNASKPAPSRSSPIHSQNVDGKRNKGKPRWQRIVDQAHQIHDQNGNTVLPLEPKSTGIHDIMKAAHELKSLATNNDDEDEVETSSEQAYKRMQLKASKKNESEKTSSSLFKKVCGFFKRK